MMTSQLYGLVQSTLLSQNVGGLALFPVPHPQSKYCGCGLRKDIEGVACEDIVCVAWEEIMGVAWEDIEGVAWEEIVGVAWEEIVGVYW